MKKFVSVILFVLSTFVLYGVKPMEQERLKEQYELYCITPSDIGGHMETLKKIASECSSVVEIGLRDMISSWGILQGLAESASPTRSYLGIDINDPPLSTLQLARQLAEGNDIKFTFWRENDMNVVIPCTDFLFIDSLHTYSHLSYELEKFAPYVLKYIAMHDTSPPWGYQDDSEYLGNYSEYPSHIDRNKRGLWPAVEDFLAKNPAWQLSERKFNCYGFTVLKRVSY